MIIYYNPLVSADTFHAFCCTREASHRPLRIMESVSSDSCVRFDDKNVRLHHVDDGIAWNDVFPYSLWYTRDDYKLFQKRDDLILSLVNGNRFYETKDHTYRGLERNGYDRYRKSMSRQAVTSEQDRQRILGINDPQKISDIYRSICSHSAHQASVRGTHDAFIAKRDTCCISATYGAALFDDSDVELCNPQRMRAHTMSKPMNPSMVSSMNAGGSSPLPPYAPRSSSAVDIAPNMVKYQKLWSSHRINLQSPQFVALITSNKCVSVDRAPTISPRITRRIGNHVHNNTSPESSKPTSSSVEVVISPLQQLKPKTLRSVPRKSSPKKSTESVFSCKKSAQWDYHYSEESKYAH